LKGQGFDPAFDKELMLSILPSPAKMQGFSNGVNAEGKILSMFGYFLSFGLRFALCSMRSASFKNRRDL
jgi:hypothetical protein